MKMRVGMTVVVVLACGWLARSDDEAANSDGAETTGLTVEQARDRATIVHGIYVDMLDAIHRDYFGEGGGRKVVPSRSLESVFRRQERRTGIEARWLAVNANAMHIDHEPQDDFEKKAVRALSRGKESHSAVVDGQFRHAGAIPLFDSCLKCHLVIRSQNAGRKVAALVVSVPLEPKTERAKTRQ